MHCHNRRSIGQKEVNTDITDIVDITYYCDIANLFKQTSHTTTVGFWKVMDRVKVSVIITVRV